jgi:hypothetical protein
MVNTELWSSEDPDARLVVALCRGILNREPLQEEVQAWLAGLRSPDPRHRISGADAAEAFLASDERKTFLARLAEWPHLFVPPGHFYSPIVAPETIKRVKVRIYPETLPGISIDRATMVRAWQETLPHLQACPFIDGPSEEFRYHFDNPAYSYGDGSTLYAMIRRHKPKRIIEIGCGWSSACALDAIDLELGGECDVTFIEPYPQLLKDLTTGKSFEGRVVEAPVQDVDLTEFDRLEENDILFIDSTHVLKTGSDVVFELAEVLPRLKKGVLVHIHDIFWPFEYPEAWVFDENRSWNEIYALRAFLTGNSEWKIHFFGNYLTALEHSRIEADFPLMLKNPGGAIWLRRE